MNETVYKTDLILKSIKYTQKEFVPVQWNGKSLYVRPILKLKDMTFLIQDVLKTCETKTPGVLAPELIDFSFRRHIVSMYSLIEMPDDLDDQYKILYETDLFDVVTKNINKDQYQGILRAINLYVGFNLY